MALGPVLKRNIGYSVYVPWSKVAILGMVIPPAIGLLPYYRVDDHPLLFGNNGGLDPGTYVICFLMISLPIYTPV